MQQPHELTTKQRIKEALTNSLYSLRYVLVGLLGAFVLFLIVYLTASEIHSRRIERSTVIVERIENDYQIWLNEDVTETSQDMSADLLNRISQLLDKYPRLYASQRALHLRGRIYYHMADWENARASFVELADRFPKSYLAPAALVAAATAMEQAERYDDAISLLKRVTDDFQTPEMPAVLFSLGRLSEAVSDNESAMTYYGRLLDEYPSSGWTNIAQSRIISLKIDRS